MEITSFLSGKSFMRDQRGITGLETAIVLIAFVVVASVFAFAVLSTGLLSAEKSKETVLGGLAETSSTISIRGDIIATANTNKTAIDSITFTLSSAAQASDPVDLSTDGVVVIWTTTRPSTAQAVAPPAARGPPNGSSAPKTCWTRGSRPT